MLTAIHQWTLWWFYLNTLTEISGKCIFKLNFTDWTHCCCTMWFWASDRIVTLEKSNTYVYTIYIEWVQHEGTRLYFNSPKIWRHSLRRMKDASYRPLSFICGDPTLTLVGSHLASLRHNVYQWNPLNGTARACLYQVCDLTKVKQILKNR